MDAGGDETGATDAFGDETGAADVCGDAGAGDPVWAVGWGDTWATDAYGDAGGAEEVGDAADLIGDEVLLTVDTFLVVDGSTLLGATIGLIWLTGEGVYGALFDDY